LGRDENWAETEAVAGCGVGLEREVVSFFSNPISFLNQANNLNSNQDLNPNTKKQCTGMNATGNSYISLIKKIIKCLKEHNLLIFLKRERIVAKQNFSETQAVEFRVLRAAPPWCVAGAAEKAGRRRELPNRDDAS
jgi:hypothetical protein